MKQKSTKLVEKETEVEKISVIIKHGFEKIELKTDNVLELLHNLPFDQFKLKAKVVFEFFYKDKSYTRMFNVAQFRRLLMNDLNKKLVAKFINSSLNIKNG